MTKPVGAKLQFQNVAMLGLSLFAIILSFQPRAIASSAADSVKTTSRAGLPSSYLQPELPPLGAPSLYLPDIPQEVRLVIRLSDRRVYLYQGDRVQESYPIAIGKAGWETPVGEHEVINKQRNPTWEHPWTGEIVPPGPDNPLGVGWIGFWTDGLNYIGFHGTPAEHLVGQAVSHGCVRMRNQDILALYAKVNVGTPVIVEP